MAYALDPRSCIAKFKRAKTHLDDLKAVLNLERQTHPNTGTAIAKFDPKTGYYVVRIATMPEEFLLECGIIAGDCISNLRGALDHLVWQLALVASDGQVPVNPKRISFPTYEFARTKRFPGGRERRGFDGAEIVKQIGTTDRATLARFQPYRGGHGKKLAALDRMWNEDKHRTLVRLRVTSSGWTNWDPRAFDPETWDESNIDFEMVDYDHRHTAKWAEIGAEIMRFRVVPMPKNKIEVETTHSGAVNLSDLGPAVEALGVLAESVRAVLVAFSVEPA